MPDNTTDEGRDLKVYFDDLRDGPTGWITVRDPMRLKILLTQGRVCELSLDYNLGIHAEDGLAIVRWMVAEKTWPTKEPIVHSIHPRSLLMQTLIKEHFPK